jgi:hypothetical protein
VRFVLLSLLQSSFMTDSASFSASILPWLERLNLSFVSVPAALMGCSSIAGLSVAGALASRSGRPNGSERSIARYVKSKFIV